ncbi:hypothetical protein BFO_1549 [Tannerella forsythia 92A2]|uniref:Uncharacterized protein n=1 Tax=Tannerella forsythia (strain ATCC 43037 / JCM 10827 / CCUG 21028 A / KCTC 5666 / FDC 338) TaxID=203275 RepID=G8ULM0_TANFA|nr:hypothetical protein BFO_1549 [Tannerella forsythia 92A2]
MRGELGTLRNFAKETLFKASFLASADIFFLLPIYFIFFIFLLLVSSMATEYTRR